MVNREQSYDPMEEIGSILRGEDEEEFRQVEVILSYENAQLVSEFLTAFNESIRGERLSTLSPEVAAEAEAITHEENRWSLLAERFHRAVNEVPFGSRVAVSLDRRDINAIYLAQGAAITLLREKIDAYKCMEVFDEVRKAFVEAGGETVIPSFFGEESRGLE